jgi:hypothetical protein
MGNYWLDLERENPFRRKDNSDEKFIKRISIFRELAELSGKNVEPQMWCCEDIDYIIACSLADAKQIAIDIVGYAREEVDEWNWYVMDRDKNFTYEDEFGKRSEKTVAEWIKIAGEGYFACSEY